MHGNLKPTACFDVRTNEHIEVSIFVCSKKVINIKSMWMWVINGYDAQTQSKQHIIWTHILDFYCTINGPRWLVLFVFFFQYYFVCVAALPVNASTSYICESMHHATIHVHRHTLACPMIFFLFALLLDNGEWERACWIIFYGWLRKWRWPVHDRSQSNVCGALLYHDSLSRSVCAHLPYACSIEH